MAREIVLVPLLALSLASPAAATGESAPAAETRIYDAPTVEAARRSIQGEIALAKKHSWRKKPLPILNATTTLTPEIQHVETGARCRFWYRSADISFPWLDDRALLCSTSYDWVTASLGFYNVNGPARPIQHGRNLIFPGPRALPDIVRALAAEATRSSPAPQPPVISAPATLRTAGGASVQYMDYRVSGPGGGPKGTAQVHHQSFRVAVVDDWVVIAGAYGAGHYRKSLDDYAHSNFEKAIASMEQAGTLPSFARR